MKKILLICTLLTSISSFAGGEKISGVVCEYATSHELAFQKLNGKIVTNNIEINSFYEKSDGDNIFSTTQVAMIQSVSAPTFSNVYKFAENKKMNVACVTVTAITK